MKIIYRVYGDWKKSDVAFLASKNINVKIGFDRFDIEEGPLYENLKSFIQDKTDGNISYGTIYDNKEINNASLLVYNATGADGYPQPEDDFGYIGTTYKKEWYCTVCGTGLIQQSPFRLKKAPKWGNKKMFELNWVFDEIFVRKDVYEEIFAPIGIKSYPVLLYKKETEIEDTVQLIITEVETPLDLENQPFEICPVCNTKKYHPQIKGFFPPFKGAVPALPIFKSKEYFGSGASAHNKIFMTQELRQKMLKHKIKSQFMPTENGSGKK